MHFGKISLAATWRIDSRGVEKRQGNHSPNEKMSGEDWGSESRDGERWSESGSATEMEGLTNTS